MKYFFIIISFFLFGACQTDNLKKVKFVVHTPAALADSEAVYITGNQTLIGNWQPDGKMLKRIDKRTWSAELNFRKKVNLEYKFTRGSWETEPTDAEGITMPNNKLTVYTDTTINAYIVNWKDQKHHFRGTITGKLIYHREMEGEGILPRDVIVWLPPSYAKDTPRRYPVLYVHDGQNIIDPRTSYTGIDWQIDEEVTRLSSEQKMQEIIVVGIYNSRTREDDYSDTPRGRAYMRFIVNKLKPFIDGRYRTLTDRENTATMGSSMGGLIAFMLPWFYPQTFSSGACLSPAFIDEYDYAIDWVRESNKKKKIRLYIDCGDLAVDKFLLPAAKEMVNILLKKKYIKNRDILWYYASGAEHNEAAWAKRVWRPLTFLFPNKK